MINSKTLRSLYDVTLHGLHGTRLMRDYLSTAPIEHDVYLIALGKAAGSMALGAQQHLGQHCIDALIIANEDCPADVSGEAITSAHPIPNQQSLHAGQRLIEFITATPPDATLMFLISGGGSAMVDVLVEGLSFDNWQAINQWLIHSGWPIADINVVRQACSRIKGGGLLHVIGGRTTIAYYLSDVCDNDPAIIASGLLATPSCARLQQRLAELPQWMHPFLHVSPLPHTDVRVTHHIVAGYTDLLKHAYHACHMQGFKTVLMSEPLLGDINACAAIISDRLCNGPAIITLWASEATLVLPEQPMQGGRCQHLALLVAKQIAGLKNVKLLVAGSDGRDGMTNDAGAIVDGDTIARGVACNLDVDEALRCANSGGFLTATKETFSVGSTQTNLMDLIIAYRGAV